MFDGKVVGLVDYVKMLSVLVMGNFGEIVDVLYISDSVGSVVVIVDIYVFFEA